MPGELDGRLAALARQPREQAARRALLLGGSSSAAGIASSSSASASKAPRSLPSSRRAGEPVLTAASKAAKSAGMVVSASRPPTTLRARSGCTSSLRDARLSSTSVSSSSRTCRRRHRSRSRRRRAARGRRAWRRQQLAGHLGGDRARLGHGGAEVDDGQRVARATAPSTLRATIESPPRRARPRPAPAAAARRRGASTASPAGGARRSRRRPPPGRPRAPVAACPCRRAGRPSGDRSRPGRRAGRGVAGGGQRQVDGDRGGPTPPLAPATAISGPPSAPRRASSPATRSRSERDHCPRRGCWPRAGRTRAAAGRHGRPSIATFKSCAAPAKQPSRRTSGSARPCTVWPSQRKGRAAA